MKYFLDQEFAEGIRKPIRWLPTIGSFNKPFHYLELISIGIVGEDGREYYAISSDFKPRWASQWVKDNVLSQLPDRYVSVYDSPRLREDSLRWKSNKQIAKEVVEFIYPIKQMADYYYISTGDFPNIIGSNSLTISDKKGRLTFSIFDKELEPELSAFKPEFYGYYADYDWVLFCSLFGTMMDLPKGFPMYCRDLKQMIDEAAVVVDIFQKEMTSDERLQFFKKSKNYPEQENEHNALADAKWNKKLYDFIKTLTK